jgi:membrane protein implicated in regulation of membrane protease activity
MVSDMVIVAAVLAAGGIAFFAWLWIGAGCFLVAALVAVCWPALAVLGFHLAVVLTLLSALWLLPRELQRREQAVRPEPPDARPR